ncbi:uncharacterized protein LOC141849732 [Brevipalpus obovatus]|uniref:uncharacterized protein LOC141849732 n=1 Tax=Brevipalpus obovatus TaxID=246614 RepID=UPI003D9E59E0
MIDSGFGRKKLIMAESEDQEPLIVATFLDNLHQLTFSAILEDRIGENEIFVDDKENVIIGSYCIQILPKNHLLYSQSSVREFSSSLDACDDDFFSLDFYLDYFQVKTFDPPEVSGSIPPSEILNEGIFCHHHHHHGDHNDDACEDIQFIDSRTSRNLHSLEQLKAILSSKLIFDKIILELSDQKDLMLIEIINPDMIVGSIKNPSKSHLNTMYLKRAIVFDYSYISWDHNRTKVQQLRQSFKTDWYILGKDLLMDLLKTFKLNDLSSLCLSISDEPEMKQSYL